MSYQSPRTPGSTPIHDYDSVYSRMSSATPTPSPRPTWADSTPRRPATRAAHSRFNSYSQASDFSPRPPKDSPRYNSIGQYSTADVSHKTSSSRRPSESSPRSKRDRRFSFTYVRASTPYGESDEDEIIEALGHTYVLPAQSRSKISHHRKSATFLPRDFDDDRGWYTNYDDYLQGASAAVYDDYYAREQAPSMYQSPQTQPSRPPTSFGHSRRSSTAVPPPRPQTVRPASSHRSKPASTPSTPKATDADARKHRIPAGYSLKNWDPAEEPILLLGSVFDANSLGKWIYDWTVYHQGPATPISDMAGEMWLLLIQLAGKVKRAEETVGRVRSADNRDLVEEFIEAGERLTEKLRSLLKACEAPMLKAAKRKQAGLGKNAGVEFVETLFGRDRELDKTEKFMQNVRLFNLRFDANCEEILRNPTK
ncbi:vegetative cell wall protein gp1 [Fusarium austroafricanum]|uniref:Vegetative cell wall protein gp1 n=1 Tax=Fusarium austroafricanum TaxID=2364996 RepID=A0A8H4NVB2_9HYPO|nr:vegetative cell wall protein gp1 [Fusarium austroafricanum]